MIGFSIDDVSTLPIKTLHIRFGRQPKDYRFRESAMLSKADFDVDKSFLFTNRIIQVGL